MNLIFTSTPHTLNVSVVNLLPIEVIEINENDHLLWPEKQVARMPELIQI